MNEIDKVEHFLIGNINIFVKHQFPNRKIEIFVKPQKVKYFSLGNNTIFVKPHARDGVRFRYLIVTKTATNRPRFPSCT